MKTKKDNKIFKDLEKVSLLDNFTNEQKKNLKILIKNQQEFMVDEKNQKETEKSLFDAKKIGLAIKLK